MLNFVAINCRIKVNSVFIKVLVYESAAINGFYRINDELETTNIIIF